MPPGLPTNVELTELRYFHCVATTRSFTEGAKLAHVTAPAVSKAIKKLEASLGTQLLTRTTRRVSITPAGEMVLRHCEAIFDSLQEITSALAEPSGEIRGDLRIGTMEAFSNYALPRALGTMHPAGETLEIDESTLRQGLEELLD